MPTQLIMISAQEPWEIVMSLSDEALATLESLHGHALVEAVSLHLDERYDVPGGILNDLRHRAPDLYLRWLRHIALDYR